MNELKIQVIRACRIVEMYGLEAYENTALSTVDRASGVMYIKPRGLVGNGILTLSLDRDNSENLHAEIYSRFPTALSILHTHAEWLSLYSMAGWSLEKSSYGYIPRFDSKIPCTERIAVDKTDTEYARLATDALEKTLTETHRTQAIILRCDGALIIGDSPVHVAEYAITLEYAAKKAFYRRKIR